MRTGQPREGLGNSFIFLKFFIDYSNMAQRKRAGLITRRSLDRNEVLLFFFPYYVRAHDSGVCNKVLSGRVRPEWVMATTVLLHI